MAILLSELLSMAAFVIVFDATGLEFSGWIYLAIGGSLALYELARLVVASAGGALTSSVITDLGFSSGTFTPYTVDGTVFIIALALLTIYSYMIMYELATGGIKK